jgi:hypothetical protein
LLRPALEDLVDQAENVRVENEEAAFRPGPALTLMPAPAASVGAPVMLIASAAHFDPDATLTYTWDLDLDGAYDDGKGAQVAYTPTAPGLMLAAARVSDGANVDVGFVQIEVKISNSPPEITAAVPAAAAPFAAVGDAVALHVDVTDADADPLTITWTVDGQPLADGPDAVFMMPDEEAHWISVVVADDDPYSPDARMTRARSAAAARSWPRVGFWNAALGRRSCPAARARSRWKNSVGLPGALDLGVLEVAEVAAGDRTRVVWNE